MRSQFITALCIAPLALAATLQADLAARGIQESADLAARGSGSQNSYQSGQSNNGGSSNYDDNSKSSGNSYNGGSSGGSTVVNNIIEENTVLVLWVNEGGGASTQTVTKTITTTVNGESQTSTVQSAAGTGQTHSVMVGGTPGLVYSPNTVEAVVGDTVLFTFMSANHTVTQSAFNTPCDKMDGGIDSSFMPNPNNTVTPPPQMAVQVTTTTPTWFYCRQTGHCGKGMTFSINPSVNKTQAMFEQMAIAQNGTGTASPITGGSAAAPPPTASTIAAASSSESSSTMVSGTGSMNNGVVECSCLCGAGTFPNAAVQGVGMLGGSGGSMPMAMMEMI